MEFAIINLSDMPPGQRTPETISDYILKNPNSITYLCSRDPMMVLSYNASRPEHQAVDFHRPLLNIPNYASFDDLEQDFQEGLLNQHQYATADGCDLGDGNSGTMTFLLSHQTLSLVPLTV